MAEQSLPPMFNNCNQRRRNSFTITDIASWSIEKRRKIKWLLSLMTEWNINYQDFCRLLQEFIAHKAAPEILLNAMKQTDESKEEQPSLYITQDCGKPQKCDMLTTEHTEDSQDSDESDCESVHGLAELSNDLIPNEDVAKHIYMVPNKEIIDAQSQQLEFKVNEDGIPIQVKTSLTDSEIVPSPLNQHETANEDRKSETLENDGNDGKSEQPEHPQQCANDLVTDITNPFCHKQSVGSTPNKSNVSDDNSLVPNAKYESDHSDHFIIGASRSSVPMAQNEETKEESNQTEPNLGRNINVAVGQQKTELSAPMVPDEEMKQISISPPASKLNIYANSFTPQPQPQQPIVPQFLYVPVPASYPVNHQMLLTAALPHNSYPMLAPPPPQVYHSGTTSNNNDNINILVSNDHYNNPQTTLQPASTQNHVHNKLTAPAPNQFHINVDEQKYDTECARNKPPIIYRQRTSVQPIGLMFRPKYANRSKGNFYTSDIMKWKIAATAKELFFTNDKNQIDVALVLYYIKESTAMQINDGQIKVVYDNDGSAIIVIDIDLHFRNDGQKMYLIAIPQNEEDYKQYGVKWQIVDMMTAQQLNDIGIDDLPQSSRDKDWFKKNSSSTYSPENMTEDEIDEVIEDTYFTSKRFRAKDNNNHRMQISESSFKECCKKALYNKVRKPLPVVVIKNEQHWIEWKQIVGVYDESGNTGFIAISLRYDQRDERWNVEKIDDDGGIVYYRHRLVALPENDAFSYTYNQLQNYLGTSLVIEK